MESLEGWFSPPLTLQVRRPYSVRSQRGGKIGSGPMRDQLIKVEQLVSIRVDTVRRQKLGMMVAVIIAPADLYPTRTYGNHLPRGLLLLLGALLP